MPVNYRDMPKKDDKQYLYQLKYILYGIMGAFYFSSRYQPRIKYLWIFLNFIVILVTQFLGTIGFFMSSTSKPIRDIIYALLTSNVVILAVFATPYITYRFKTNIEQILALAEEEFFASTRIDSSQIRSAKVNINKMIFLQVVSVNVSVLIHPLVQFFYGNNDTLNELDYYVFPSIWLGSVQTTSQYYVIYMIHFMATELVLISVITFSIYVCYVGQEFCVAFSALRNFLEDFSTLAKGNLEKALNDVILDDTHKKTRLQNVKFEQYKMTQERNNEEMLSNLITAIKAHQILFKKMRRIKPHIEFLFSSVATFLTADQCFFVYMMCSTDVDFFLKTKEILGILYINVILFTYCLVGKWLDDAVNSIPTQLSDIPWYYLTSQQRQTYHIFLSQTQRTMQFKAFGVYAMNMPLVLQNIKFIFSLYNILRQVLNE